MLAIIKVPNFLGYTRGNKFPAICVSGACPQKEAFKKKGIRFWGRSKSTQKRGLQEETYRYLSAEETVPRDEHRLSPLRLPPVSACRSSPASSVSPCLRIFLPLCLSSYLSSCLSLSLPVSSPSPRLPLSPCLYLIVCLSNYLSLSLSLYRSLCIYLCLCLCLYFCLCLSPSLSLSLFVCLSVCLSVCL